MNKKLCGLCALAALAAPLTAKADLFDLHVVQPGTGIDKVVGFDSVMDIFHAYQDGKLNEYFAGYSTTQNATANLNFRGVPINLTYTTGGGSNLRLQIPSIGYDKVFAGATQQEAFTQFKEEMKANAGGLLKDLVTTTVKTTPYDSIAGNPSSLMNTMADAGFDNPVLATTNAANASGQNGGFVILNPSAGKHQVKDVNGRTKEASTISVPLGYTFKFKNNWALGLDMPLSYTDFDGSVTYSVQLGATLQIPMFGVKGWLLNVSGRAGATASEDSLSGGILYMGSATSSYTFKVKKYEITVLNMYGYLRDYALDVKGYNVSYNLRNNVYKNGLSVKIPLSEKYSLSVFGYDTRYTGSKLYIDSYDEVGFNLFKAFKSDSFFTGLNFSAMYSFGDNYKAYKVGLGLSF